MNLQQYTEWTLQPITEQNPIGEELLDNADFDFIEAQMMKIGTLSHGSIEWHKVAELSAKLLGKKSKDIRVFSALLKSLNHNMTPATWIASFDIMNAFISGYWQFLHPININKSATRKHQYFDQILQQLVIAADKVDYASFNKKQKDHLSESVNLWQKTIIDAKLNNNISTKLIAKIEQESKKATNKSTTSKSASNLNPTSNSNTKSEQAFVAHDNTKTQDASKKRLTLPKDYLADIANNLADDEALIPIAIQLKRHILWREISLPQHNAEKKTALKPFNAERAADYYQRLKTADLVLWQQIEQSISLSPFWFEGQWLSYQVANKLNQPLWCEAILHATSSLLETEPDLSTLYFSDGTAFISNKIKNWLQSSLPSQVNSWQDKWLDLNTLYKKEGMSSALAYINHYLQKAIEPREIAHWQWFNIKLLAENNLNALAKKEAQTLLSFISQMKIEDWEPSLVKELQDYTAAK